MTMKNKTILVIEDEKSLLEVVKTKLEKSGFNVITSRSVTDAFGMPLSEDKTGAITLTSVEKALKHLNELEQVNAIWLDHNLIGEEDGLDFVTKLKANGGKWSEVPIFVISNTSDPELVKTYAKLGANKYYIKAEYKLEKIIEEINAVVEVKKL